jgi:hypothetical protein
MSAKLRNELSKLASLRWSRETEFEELAGFAMGTLEGSRHRALAVVGGAMIEEALRRAISKHLAPARSADCDALLFEDEHGPLNGLAARTRMAHALGIIDDNARSDLTFIRGIRIAFAHSPERISFAHATILESLNAIHVLKNMPGEEELKQIAGPNFDAMRFTAAVAIYCGMLRIREPFWQRAWTQFLADALLKPPIDTESSSGAGERT